MILNSAESSAATSATRSRGGLRNASRPRTRPTCCSSCSTTSASRSSAATAPTSPPPTSTASRPTACGSRTSTPRRSARRRARVSSPAATTTATAWAGSPTSPSGYPGYCGDIPRAQRLPLRDPPRAGLRDVRGRQVAPHTRRRDAHGRRSQLVAARPRVRPLVRVPRWRDPPVRPHALLRQPLGAAAAHASTRATTSAPISPTARSSSSSDLRNVDDEQPLLLVLRDRRVPLAAPRAARVDRALPRPVRRGVGRVGASERTRASSKRGSSRRAPRCHHARRGYPPGTTCTSPTRRSRPGSWSASPRSSRTPTTRSVV